MKNHEPSFSERMKTSAAAKELQRARTKDLAVASSEGLAERQVEQKNIAVAREARVAQRNAAKLLKAAELAAARAANEAELVAKAAAEEEAIKAENEARVAERETQRIRDAALLVEQKATRDARYAARKARQR